SALASLRQRQRRRVVQLAARALGETPSWAGTDRLLLLLCLGPVHLSGPILGSAPAARRLRAGAIIDRRRHAHPSRRRAAVAATDRSTDGTTWAVHSGEHDPRWSREVGAEPIEP